MTEHRPGTAETASAVAERPAPATGAVAPAATLRPESRVADERPCVIVAEGVQKEFGGRPVLRDLSLAVGAGEIYGLIGPSGSGKSTTVHLLCGHLRPNGGSVSVFGQSPARFSTATRRRLGYMAQGFVLYPDLTVAENVAFAAGLYGLSEWRCRDTIRATLELVELWEARKRPAHKTSGGMQRRIALAAALVHDPDLLFADEPTANLDPILRAKLWAYFRERADGGRTLLVTTQYIDEAEYCDRVGLMFDGVLIAEGRPQALRQQAFGGDVVDLLVEQPRPAHAEAIAALPGVREATLLADGRLRATVADAESAIPPLLDALEAAGAPARSVAPYRPTFDEVFIRLIEQHGDPRPPVGRLQTSAADRGDVGVGPTVAER